MTSHLLEVWHKMPATLHKVQQSSIDCYMILKHVQEIVQTNTILGFYQLKKFQTLQQQS